MAGGKEDGMKIDEVLIEMRDWKWGLSPRVRAWADAIEAAMREPVAEQAVIDRIAPAMEILSDHDEEMYPAEAALALDRARIRSELAALKPDAAQAELLRITEQLAERDAEIERLRALLSDGREIVAEKLPAYRLWVKDVDAALAGKEPQP